MNRRVKRVKVRRLKPWARKALFIIRKSIIFILVIIGLVSIFNKIFNKPVDTCKYDSTVTTVEKIEVAKNEEVKEETQLLDIAEQSDEEDETQQETETVFKEIEQKPVIEKSRYRMTYYYPGDDTNSGSTTASGKGAKDFQLNDKGWYTYNGKLVVATASKRLLSWDRYKNSTEQTYNLYDELTLTIDGEDYDAVVMDVCGACMKDTKIDLFVKDRSSGLDTAIDVRRK